MPIRRRWILGLVAAGPALLRLPTAAAQQPAPADASLGQLATPRTLGSPNAKIKVTEFFSLTCTHCAAFQRETFPQVKAQWVDPGKLQMIYHDFPLDRVALQAAMVARALPPDRYEPFITTLFASQDRWAFQRGINPTDEIKKLALLAGMSEQTFQATIANQALQNFILAESQEAEHDYHVDSTPTFLVNGKTHPGEMSYDAFVKFVTSAAG
jgi:protein-disulfide isomerase